MADDGARLQTALADYRARWPAEAATVALFEALLEDRKPLVSRRRLWRSPLSALATQLSL